MADDQETEFCSNCKRQIASANFIMHEVHCRRNIVLCERCEEPVPRSEMDAHFEEYHSEVPCSLCKKTFERSALEDHMPQCPKRTTHCDYCQLDMPACDLDEHKDYCGTRTEPCPLCSQFIMHRDWDQHELTLCAYPPPKRSPDEPSNNHGAAPGARPARMPDAADELDAELLNPFAMSELNRMLTESSLSRPVHNNINNAASTAAAPGASTRRGTTTGSSRSQIRPRPRLHINRNISRTKNTNESAQSRRVANNETGRQARNPPPQNWTRNGRRNSPPDLDEILARHLAQDLGSDLYSGGQQLEDLSQPNNTRHVQRSPPVQMEQNSDDVSLPCEFCDELFPMEYFFEHQSSCNPRNSSAYRNVSEPVNISPQLSPSDNYDNILPNNSPRRSSNSNLQPPRPPIVDNLSMLAAQDWFTSPEAAAGGLDGETMLPCEFCYQLYPDDLLVQHQAVCEVNFRTPPPTRTPESRSSISSRSIHSRSNVIGASEVESTRSRASRRQGDPTFDYLGNSELEETSIPTTGTATRGRFRPSGRRGINKEVNRNSGVGGRTRASPVETYSNTNSSFNRRGEGSRKPGQGTAGRGAVSGLRDASPAPVSRKPPAEQRRPGSETRSNRSFQQLRRDPNSSTHELLAALEKQEKSNRNQKTKEAANGSDPDTGDQSDLSLRGAVNGGKSRRSNHRFRDVDDGVRGYDPSFGSTSRQTTRVSSKPRPVAVRAVEFSGASNLRDGKSRASNAASSRRNDSTVRTPDTGPARKRTSSRPRNAPQGEP